MSPIGFRRTPTSPSQKAGATSAEELPGASELPSPTTWRSRRDERGHQRNRLDERLEIELVYRGVDLAPPARVVNSAASRRPWALPVGFDVDSLDGEAIHAAIKLGVLTPDVLTQEQREKYLAVGAVPVSPAAAASLFSLIGSAYALGKKEQG